MSRPAGDAPEPRFSTGRSILYSAILVLGFFGLVEVVLRWVDPAPPLRPRLILRAIDVDIEFPFMRADPELFWSPRPGYRGEFMGQPVTIDSHGLRGPELRVPKPPGRRRVLCFGDSITFGYGLGDADTYPARLEAALADRGVEVGNAGVTGYTSLQVLGRLRRLAPELGADLATICIGWNDGTLRPVEDRVYASRLASTQAIQGTLEGWRLYRLLAGFYVRSRIRAENAARVRERQRVPLDRYRENLEEIVALCRRTGIRPVLVRLPHRRLPGEPDPQSPYDVALVELGRSLEVPVLSVGRLGLESDEADTGALFIDSLHLSPAGSEVMAELLARQLVDADLL